MTCCAYMLAVLPAWFFTSIGSKGLGLAVWLGCIFYWHHTIRRTDKEVLADKAKWEALLARRDSLLRKAQIEVYPETRLESFALLEEIDQILAWSLEDEEIDRGNTEMLLNYREHVERALCRITDQLP